MTISNLMVRLFLATAFVYCALGLFSQSTHSALAEDMIVPQPISYSPPDGSSPFSGAMARTKKIRMACYPVGGECTKNSDCCTGYCRSGLATAYCDNP